MKTGDNLTEVTVMIFGIITAVLSGAAMSLQGVMNTRLSDKIGLMESNVFVQGTAFFLSLIAVLIFGKGNFQLIRNTPPVYLLGGVLGLIITLTVMVSINNLNPTTAISIILIAQLLVAALIDAFGILESEKVAFTYQKVFGVILMIAGVILIKWKAA